MSRALGNVSRAALEFVVEKMLLGPSHGTQALSECQTIFSDDFGTLQNDLQKSFGPRASYLGDQIFLEAIGSPDFLTFGCVSVINKEFPL